MVPMVSGEIQLTLYLRRDDKNIIKKRGIVKLLKNL